MQKQKHVMLDLETMGNSNNAAIVAIGAVEFCPAEQKLGREFYAQIDLVDSAKYGKIDASTVLWWLQQEEAARKELYGGNRMHLMAALLNFSSWLEDNVGLWGNGVAFDNVILRSAYAATDLATPWSHKQDRCYRTVMNMYPHLPPNLEGIKHNALDDAKFQVLHLMNIYVSASIPT